MAGTTPTGDAERWVVFGFITGPLLPSQPLVMPRGVIIGPISEESLRKLPRGRATGLRVSNIKQGYSLTPADIFVYSRWLFSAEVKASNSFIAFQKVQLEIVPRVLTVLNTVGQGDAYRLELVRAESEHSQEPPMPYAEFSLQGPEFMSSEAEQRVLRRLSAVESDETARRACWNMHEGVRLLDRLGDVEAGAASALLRFFFVIEAIATRLYKETRREVVRQQEKEEEAIVARLRDDLKRDHSKQVSAIHKASTNLRKLDGAHLADQIRSAGDSLGVETNIVTAAVRFSRFRNERLGHAGLELQWDELRPWLPPSTDDAYLLCRKFLDGYFRQLGELG